MQIVDSFPMTEQSKDSHLYKILTKCNTFQYICSREWTFISVDKAYKHKQNFKKHLSCFKN